MRRSTGRQQAETLHFGRCELHYDARELRLDGELQHVEPRVFDLLAYLVQHHERVVTRDELLVHVWPTEHVSETVVAHCIMKARRAIGDGDSDVRQIKTLHRSGYRYVGEVRRAGAEPTQRAARSGALSVAVLPFRNSSGDAALVWVELGLPTLVIRTLEAQPGLNVLPLLDVAAAAAREAGANGSAASLAAGVQRRLGADAVLEFEVLADGGEPYLSFSTHRGSGAPSSATSRGRSLTDLAVACAQQLARELAAAESPPLAWPFDGDAFLAEAFARGMQALARQRFQVALNYLQICVDAEPHPLEVDVEYVARLAAVAHPSTPDHAARALERAARAGDAVARRRVQVALSAYYYYDGEHDLARAATDAALASFDEGATSNADEHATLLLRRIELALGDRDFDMGQRLVGRVLAIATRLGADRLTAQALSRRAILDQLCGRHDRALRDLDRACAISRERALRSADLALALIRKAVVLRDGGELAQALPLIDEGVARAQDAGLPMRGAHALAIQVVMASEAGLAERAQRACEGLRERRIVASPAGVALLHISQAWMAWRNGELERALEHLDAGNERLRKFPYYWFGHALGVNIGVAIEAGRFGRAGELIGELRAHQRFAGDLWLQGAERFYGAALAHAEGRRDEARRGMREAIELSPSGIVRAHACMSAIWLASEDGRLDAEMRGRLQEIEPWARGRFCGLVVLARYRCACGDFEGAVAAQSQAIDAGPAQEIGEADKALLAAYQAALAAGRSLSIEPVKLLPTLRF